MGAYGEDGEFVPNSKLSREALPSRLELLHDLNDAIRDKDVNVAAIRLLLEELRRDQDDQPAGSEFDELDNVTPIRKPA